MEVTIRGLLENLIDDLTAEKSLTTSFIVMKSFKPIVKSEQDAVFGYIIARAISTFSDYYYDIYKREPNNSEIQKFRKMLEERANIIMSKIQKFSNR